MPKETGALQDIWTGWLDFWRESLSIVGVKTQGKGRNKLENKQVKQVKLENKQAVTRRNRVKLKRDITKLRRPRPQKIETDTDVWDTAPRQEVTDVKDVKIKEEYEKRVAPPKQFDLPESALETPQERKVLLAIYQIDKN